MFANNLVVQSRVAPGTLSWAQHGASIPDADLFFSVTGGSGVVDVGLGPTAQECGQGNLFLCRALAAQLMSSLAQMVASRWLPLRRSIRSISR